VTFGLGRSNGMSNHRMASLDGLRAVSILAVIVGHLTGTRGFPLTNLRISAPVAHMGVTIFFVISGFLITTLLLQEQAAVGAVSIRNFYVRRAIRILPASMVFIGVMVAVSQLGWVRLTRNDLLAAFTWTVNYLPSRSWTIGHMWSLSVEEQFYLIWPVTVVMLGLVGVSRAAAFIFLLGPIVRGGLRALSPHLVEDYAFVFPAVADSIAVGCLVALERGRLLASNQWLYLTRSALAPGLIGIAFTTEYLSGYFVVDVLMRPIELLTLAALVEGSTRYVGAAHSVLNWAPCVWIGTLSYSLYLWQQPFLDRSVSGVLAGFPVNLAAAFGMACLSFYLVERPILRFSRPFRLASAGNAARRPGATRLTTDSPP
jgi:peptidoglycan/LPS O-acetylase OafA/YrhL